MASELRWNRLIINSADDVESAKALASAFPKLLAVEFPVIECDLVAVKVLGKATLAELSRCFAVIEKSGKTLVLRIGANLEAAVATVAIPKGVSVDVVRHLNQPKDHKSSHKAEGEISVFTAPKSKKPESGYKGAQTPLKTSLPPSELPGMGRKNRPTLVGLPRALLDDDSAHVRPAADGIEELIFDELNPGDQADLVEVEDSVLHRDPGSVPELTRAWLRDSETGEVREIGEGLTIGREVPADWRIPLPTISKLHFRIFRDKNRYFLDDLEATNGTFIGNVQVVDIHVPLLDGDRIVMAITLNHPAGTRSFTFHGSKPK